MGRANGCINNAWEKYFGGCAEINVFLTNGYKKEHTLCYKAKCDENILKLTAYPHNLSVHSFSECAEQKAEITGKGRFCLCRCEGEQDGFAEFSVTIIEKSTKNAEFRMVISQKNGALLHDSGFVTAQKGSGLRFI